MDRSCFFGHGNFPLVDIVNLTSQSQGSFANRKTVTSSTPQLSDFRPHSKLTKLKLATLVRFGLWQSRGNSGVLSWKRSCNVLQRKMVARISLETIWWPFTWYNVQTSESPRGWRLPRWRMISTGFLGHPGLCPPLRYHCDYPCKGKGTLLVC